MEFKKDKQYIIITSHPYQYLILKYKSIHPELNIKIIDIAQAKTDLSYSFSLDAYKYLIKNNISYSKAKKYLEVLPFLDRFSPFLSDLFIDMKDKGLFVQDEIKQFAYKGKEIYLFECKEERTLKTLLDRNELSYSYLSIADLGYQIKEKKKIEVFEDLFEEYMYVFSSIKKDIQEDKIPINNIEIITPVDDDLFYLNYFSYIFKIPLSMKVGHPLISDENCLELMQYFEKNRTFVVNFDENNDIDKCIKKIIDDYDLASLTDFNYALLNLKEIISRHTISFPATNGLSISSSLSYKEHLRHYVLGVQHGN